MLNTRKTRKKIRSDSSWQITGHQLESLESRVLLSATLVSPHASHTGDAHTPMHRDAPSLRAAVLSKADNLRTGAQNVGTLTQAVTRVDVVGKKDRVDFFHFTVDERQPVRVVLANLKSNANMVVHDMEGSVIGRSTNRGTQKEIIQSTLDEGSYTVRVYHGKKGQTKYRLRMIPLNAVNQPKQPNSVVSNDNERFNIDLKFIGNDWSDLQKAIVQQAAQRWEKVVVGDLPNVKTATMQVDDILIEVRSMAMDGSGGKLAQAQYLKTRPTGNPLPYHGLMQFDSADLERLEQRGDLLDVATHEMGHVLGLGIMWKGNLIGSGTGNPGYTGKNALREYQQIFNTSVSAVPLDNTGESGTRESHWRDAVLDNEIMTGYINIGASNVISRITIGLLQDLGYFVDYRAAEPYMV